MGKGEDMKKYVLEIDLNEYWINLERYPVYVQAENLEKAKEQLRHMGLIIKFSQDENPLLNQCTLESNTFEYEDLDWIEECA